MFVVPFADFFRPRTPQRQREHDQLIPDIGADVHSERRRIEMRKIEWCAVGEDAARRGDLDLAQGSRRMIELELREAPVISLRRARTRLQQSLEVAIMLLKMLRLKEHPFRPDDLIIPGHIGASSRSLRVPGRHRYRARGWRYRPSIVTLLASSLISTVDVRFGTTVIVARHCARSR